MREDDYVSCAAAHVSHQLESTYKPAIVKLLPMFLENVHSVAMIRHAIEMVKFSVHQVNPDQVPVITLDEPLFAIAKQIQWN